MFRRELTVDTFPNWPAGIPLSLKVRMRKGKSSREGFQGIIRWATLRDETPEGGYVTLALDHTHLMAFTNHLVAEERTCDFRRGRELIHR
jgi:hypothetical protein